MRGFGSHVRTAAVAAVAAISLSVAACDNGGNPSRGEVIDPEVVEAICDALEVVVLVDTSPSMEDEAEAICATVTDLELRLLRELRLIHAGAHVTVYGIGEEGELDTELYPCVDSTLTDVFGHFVPGGGVLTSTEDWGPAVAIVADGNTWMQNTLRSVVSWSDEAPKSGDPCLDPGDDRDFIEAAIDASNANGVVAVPIVGTDAGTDDPGHDRACIVNLADDLADGTGGTLAMSDDDDFNLDHILLELFVDYCTRPVQD
jgi:hypothetical protein